ncbi:glycosyltransferase family 4 protein [Anaerosalibacter bizertensis]|uniref:Glycosyltransferase family 4 protein n=2 Tax=Anaerosalibacter bizertensis TaxID=932217 RepID=A0A844FEX7_9FIRM|nr:glycosyltransferase family 4 protein [Anaerosalibacter bizertensis]
MMKVLHLISGGDTGGAKTHIINLLTELDKIMDVKIICFLKGDFFHDLKAKGINIEVFKQKKRYDMSIVSQLREEIEREDYDIIHCHGARANFIAMFLKTKVKGPFITTIHSDYKLDFKDNPYKNIVYTAINTISLKKFDYYIAISTNFKQMLVERGFDSNSIFTIYNGIDLETDLNYISKEKFLERYNINAKGKTIVGIAARLDLVKDHDTFIEGAYKVLQKRKDIIFLIAGDGSEKERLVSKAQDLNISEYVYFLGFIKDPYSFFNAIDINILTSVSESFPYVILEGARFKKTIISTDVGGISDLIRNGHNGFLIDVGDSEALAKNINFLLDNKSSIKILGENLYENVKDNFSSQKMALDHFKVYKKIIETRR